MPKKQHPKREVKPARDKAGRFTKGGPALVAGSLDSNLVTETEQPNLNDNKDNTMSKNTTTPVVTAEGTTTLKNLADKGFKALKTTVSDVTPASVMDKMPSGVKTAAGYTPVSAVVGLVLYGLYRKFFRKAEPKA